MIYRSLYPCPKCLRNQTNLKSHFEKSCFKHKSPLYRQIQLNDIKNRYKMFVSRMIIKVSEISNCLSQPDPLVAVCELLQETGHLVNDDTAGVQRKWKRATAERQPADGEPRRRRVRLESSDDTGGDSGEDANAGESDHDGGAHADDGEVAESVDLANRQNRTLAPETPSDAEGNWADGPNERGDEFPELDIDFSIANIRKRLQKAGLMRKISYDDPWANGFFDAYVIEAGQSEKHLHNLRNLLRRLFHFLGSYEVDNPVDFNLEWLLLHPNRVNHWLQALSRCEYQPGSLKNCFEAVNKFLSYLESNVDASPTIPDFYERIHKCKSVLLLPKLATAKGIRDCQRTKIFNRDINRDPVDTGFFGLTDSDVCVARWEEIYDSFAATDLLEPDDETFVMRLCFCIIVVKYFQRPGVVRGLTLNEYERQHANGCIFVKEHKTRGCRPAFFPFDDTDKMVFEFYRENVRPKRFNLATNKDKTTKFFINQSGRPISNASKDVAKFQRFNLGMAKSYSSTVIRSAVESLSASDAQLTVDERKLINKYMQHGEQTSERFYERFPKDAVLAVHRLTNEMLRRCANAPDTFIDEAYGEQEYDEYYQDFDSDTAPDFFDDQEYVNNAFEHLADLETDNAREFVAVERGGNDGGSSEDQATLESLKQRCATQQWPNVKKAYFGPDVNLGVVVAHNPFEKGDVICDYHGRKMKRWHFLDFRKQQTEPMRKLIDRYNVDYDFDSHRYSIMAHENDGSFGRLINHCSVKGDANCEPKSFPIGQGDAVVMFKATRRIEVGAQLVWNYNEKKYGVKFGCICRRPVVREFDPEVDV